MSYEGVNDKDLGLKLRLMRLLWKNGWFVRPSIQLYGYAEGKRTSGQLTEIDVFGIRFLEFARPVVCIASAKSGAAKDVGELFWLSGVQEYFKADYAIYIRTRAGIERLQQTASSIGILPMNESQLVTAEKLVGLAASTPTHMFSADCYGTSHRFLRLLKDRSREIHRYLTEQYWIDQPPNQLMRTITCANDIRSLGIDPQVSLFLRWYCASLCVVSALRVLSPLITFPPDLLRSELRTVLMGGHVAEVEKRRLLHAVKQVFEAFMEKYQPKTLEQIGTPLDVEALERISNFDHLYDLMVRLQQRITSAAYVPQILDVIAFEFVGRGRRIGQELLTTLSLTAAPPNLLGSAFAATKDVTTILERCGVFAQGETKDLMAMESTS